MKFKNIKIIMQIYIFIYKIKYIILKMVNHLLILRSMLNIYNICILHFCVYFLMIILKVFFILILIDKICESFLIF